MKMLLIVYRVLTFILLPIVAILGFIDISLLLMALANPAALLPAFAIACIVIYLFTSLNFLNKGITAGKPCKLSLRDWIRVNAFVSIAFSTLGIIEYITVLNNKAVRDEMVKQAMAQQGVATAISSGQMEQILLSFLFIFLIFSLALIVHIVMTFRLLKEYGYLFK